VRFPYALPFLNLKTLREKWRTIVVCAALALGTLILYAPVLNFDFVNFDDPHYVIDNFHLRGGLGWHGLAWSFKMGYDSNWIPLVWLSYMLDYQCYALNPAGYHASNVLLHTANAVLLFLILKRMTGAFWRSAMVAALFAWHPAHVESVAWISERKDVLSTLFWMLTIWAYLNYAGKGGAGRYFLVLLLFALGLMAKSMLVTLPFVLWLLDGWPLRRFQSKTPARKTTPPDLTCPAKTPRQLILEKAPMLLLAAGCSLLTVVMQNRAGTIAVAAQFPLASRLQNALVSYCLYMEKLIWPVNLSFIYLLRTAWPWGGVVAAIVVLAAISTGAVCLRKRCPYLMLGWLWYLGTLVPVIGLVQVGTQGMADRYTYIPSIGLFIMICWGVFDLVQFGARVLDQQILKNRNQWVPGGFCLATLVLCGLATSNQLQYWRDGGALCSRAIALDPNNFLARVSYGVYLLNRGLVLEARLEFQKAVQISPQYSLARAFHGVVLRRVGELDAAAAELRIAVELNPADIAAQTALGAVFLDQNLPAEAAAKFALALHNEPDDPNTHYLMGKALAMQGRLDEAGEQFSEALRLQPQLPDAHYQLGVVLSMQHKTTEAVAHYRMALNLQSAMLDALNNLAWILATDPHAEIRNGAEAVRLARRACALTQDSRPLLLGTLAAAYAEAGQFDEAIASAQKAHDLAVAQGRSRVAAKNLELLELFRSHHAYHEKS
jgi:protein O-mannosyl-transferase